MRANRVDEESLGGPRRFLTALSTDKPIYRPGETVWVRGVLLGAFDRRPLSEIARPAIEVRGPKGEEVASGTSVTQDSVWAFSWRVPEGIAGGEYTLRASYPQDGHAPVERKFDVRVFRAPRLKTQILFQRDGYGPGDKVTATADVKRAEGGVPAGAKVTVTAIVDGVEVARLPASVGPKGDVKVSFDLPRTIARGEGAVAFAIEDGGVVEIASKTLPILLQTLDLTLFPEGGDLAGDVDNRVYFQALTPARKPADIAGVVSDSAGREVARFRSEHEGRGRFDMRPMANETYTLRVTEPAGIKTTWTLPAVVVGGVSLRARREVIAPGGAVEVTLASARPRTVTVIVSQRERALSQQKVRLVSGNSPVDLTLDPRSAEGVLMVTVLGERGEPLAERLVFRQPRAAINIALSTDKPSYVPGESVALTATATRAGRPVSVVVGLTVTDDSVLELIEKREQAPRLPVMVFLEPEVRELADAHVYLDAKNPRAPRALDLLLGTQGWRRFAVMNFNDFVSRHGDEARRVLAMRFPRPPPPPMMRPLPMRVRRNGVPSGVAADEGVRPVADLEGAVGPDRAAVAKSAPALVPSVRPANAPISTGAFRRERPQEAGVAAQVELAVAEPKPEPARALVRQNQVMAKEEVARDRGAFVVEEKRIMVPVPQPVVIVREYAHAVPANRGPDERTDFTETVYWNAGVRTNARTGKATVRFALNDSVTAFRVFADAFSNDGAVATATSTIKAVQPFYAEPKLPLEVTAGDLIRLPLALVNGTPDTLRGASVALSSSFPTGAAGLDIGVVDRLDLRPGERVRRLVDIAVGTTSGVAELTLNVTANPYVDIVKRTLPVKPAGFPGLLAVGGLIKKGGTVSHTLRLPNDVVPGSVRTSITVYPAPLANLTRALERLIRDPYGCFEQTSSTTYPLTMAQQYFKSHSGVNPKLIATASEKLDAGYQRLVSFECTEKGYEWFGENPGHEALTAYGLLHFSDMAVVRPVDPVMLSRTRQWLLNQRDGKGGFSRKRRALHTWVEDPDASNGYILWALLESRRDADGADSSPRAGLEAELTAFKAAAAKSTNSYVTALGANVLALAGESAAVKPLLDKLVAKQGKDGVVEGATTSIVGSGGQALAIETTALAVLAWLRDSAYAGPVEKAMKFLADSCQDGRYGSTQSTVLALRAIVAYDKARSGARAPGRLVLALRGKVIGEPLAFTADAQEALVLPDVAQLLAAGENAIELRMEGGSAMPYSIAVDYHALTPVSAPEAKVGLAVKLSRTQATEGDLLEALATIENRASEAIPTPVAIIGLPGGLEPRHDQLKELVRKKLIDSYEVLGRDVVLYWRALGPNQKISVPLSLIAAVPGRFTGPASRAYLYYTDEHKVWVDGLKVDITPKS